MINLAGIRKSATFANSSVPEGLFTAPFITLAREPGSGGALIGQRVAKKLNYEYVDHQIIEEIAQSTKMRNKIIETIDEKARTSIEDLVHSHLNKDYVSDYKYISELCKVILAYAYKGHVVILGRGANFITPKAKGLHVRITAPKAIRQIRAVKYEGLSVSEAKERVMKVEQDRAEFVKKYFKRDIKKSSYYDMVLNTAFYSIEDATDLVVEAFYKKFSLVDRYRGIFGK